MEIVLSFFIYGRVGFGQAKDRQYDKVYEYNVMKNNHERLNE